MDPSNLNSEMRAPRVVALLPVLGQPRYAKRIDNLKSRGLEVKAAAFARDYHRGRIPSCDIAIIGSAVRGRYWSRIWAILKATRSMRRELNDADLAYAFGPDMALLALIARGLRRIPVVLEIADIHPIQTNRGLKSRFVRWMDRAIARRCELIVSTTPKFISEYYRRWLRCNTPALVLDNKVESDFARQSREQPLHSRGSAERRARIGWFGCLRCAWALQVLGALARRHADRFEVLLAGYTIDSVRLEDHLGVAPNIEFVGQYKSPADLPRLYGDIDVMWGCYPPIRHDDWNHKWARPNRFYESCTFKVPLISREGSCDAVDVARFGIGLVLSEEDPVKAADFIA